MKERNLKLKQLLDVAGLDYDQDAGKRRTKLSGLVADFAQTHPPHLTKQVQGQGRHGSGKDTT
jgi:hypothetical protein